MLDIIITIIAILAIFILWVIIFDTNRFVVRRYQVSDNRIGKPCKAVVLSDLHNKCYGKNNEKLIEEVDALKPDFLLVAGDMITSRKKAPTKNAVELLKNLVEKYPIYYANGNHEYRLKKKPERFGDIGEKYFATLQELGIEPLENAGKEIAEYNLAIYGLEIEGSYYERFQEKEMPTDYVTGLLGAPDEKKYTVLLAHNPDYFKEYAAWGADLTVSGHIHGGIARVPFWGKGVISPTFKLFPEYDGGLFEKDNATMVLGRGLGTHSLPVRVFNPAELCVIDFIPE